ncbi:MAG: cell division FtsK/SpoIIIE [bacterium P3]|nr:MAG: cell division FtsK/SpoIIIE [bacterium P3]KWW42674.1 MAG: cell division FtsK/SpoIIIE [bacterium F083]
MAKKKKSVKPTSRFIEWWRSQRGRRLRGAVYILFSFFSLISILSFFIGAADPDGNWMGVLGHHVALFFTHTLFGIGSLGLVLLVFLYGCRLWGHTLLPWPRIVGVVAFWTIWLSTTLGYIAGVWVKNDLFENYAGIGIVFAGLLHHLIRWGTLVLMAFLAVVFLIFVHKVQFRTPDLSRLLPARPPRKPSAGKPTSQTPAPVITDSFAFDNSDPFADTATVADSPDNTDDPGVDFTADDDSTFGIDDAFVQLVEKVQGKPQPPEPVEPADQAPDEVTFTIVDNQSPAVPLPDAESVSEADPPAEEPRYGSIDSLYDPHLDLRDFQMPSTDMLQDWEQRNVRVTSEELVANKDRIVSTLRDYGIEIVEIAASPGPTVTLYEIKPAAGVRISKIKGLEDDIALSLSALGIRIIAPIPGKGTVGIEVPNAKPQIVSMKTMLESSAFRGSAKMELPVALGKTISNEPYVTDLAKMPHLLMAGATGTGKSVGLNAVISSLLYKKHPSELKFVMVDPKKVELSLYSKIERHYLAKLPDSEEAIITDVKKVVRTLNSLCIEMDQRYDLLKTAQVRKITEYNDKFVHRHLNPENGHRYLPYIVLVIDEFADLIMTAGKEVETPICRLAQLARAVGIHLIIATQRPTANIITGTIKANFPARIAFKVTSGVDSRTILDASGAQRLIGRGDMLISLSGADMVRLQCALIETEEIERLADFIGGQRGYPDGFLLPEYLDENEEPNKEFDPKQKDEFFNDAARLVVSSQFGSTSLLQRKLQLGYNRAGRIIDQLEAAGIVGPYNGAKPREVLVHDDVALEEILRSL